MRPLTETETRTLFEKLASYTGKSLNNLIAPPSSSENKSERHVFRIQNNRVYYVKESIANLAGCFAREKLLSLGTYILGYAPMPVYILCPFDFSSFFKKLKKSGKGKKIIPSQFCNCVID
jgi:hypothetical protein